MQKSRSPVDGFIASPPPLKSDSSGPHRNYPGTALGWLSYSTQEAEETARDQYHRAALG